MPPGVLQAKWAEVKILLHQDKENLPIGSKWQQDSNCLILQTSVL